MIQGGDREHGDGTGGTALADFPTEVNQRLRFAARGLVATAPGPRGNTSQFFVTLAPNVPLERSKHTIFGKVVGDSVFNLLRANECVVGEDDRPLFPPVIHRAEVLDNPFPDLGPRPGVSWRSEAAPEEKKKTRQPRRKNTNMLSFGEEGEEELLGAAEGGHLLRMQPRDGDGGGGAGQAEPEQKKAKIEEKEKEEEEEDNVMETKEESKTKEKKKKKDKKKKKKKEKEEKSKKKEKKEAKESSVKPLVLKSVPTGAPEEKDEAERAKDVAKYNEKKLKQRSASVTKKQQEETAAKFAAFRKQLAKK